MIRASIYVAAFGALAWSLAGCHSGGAERAARETLAQGAHVIPDSTDLRIRHQDDLDAKCQLSSHTFPEWRACMEPAYRIDRAAGAFGSILLAAQSAMDASGADGFRVMAPCLVEAAGELADALTAAGLPVPGEVSGVLALGATFAGTCTAPHVSREAP